MNHGTLHQKLMIYYMVNNVKFKKKDCELRFEIFGILIDGTEKKELMKKERQSARYKMEEIQHYVRYKVEGKAVHYLFIMKAEHSISLRQMSKIGKIHFLSPSPSDCSLLLISSFSVCLIFP